MNRDVPVAEVMCSWSGIRRKKGFRPDRPKVAASEVQGGAPECAPQLDSSFVYRGPFRVVIGQHSVADFIENLARRSGAAKIYFIKDASSLAIKIGHSRNPTKRLGSLQTANPHPLMMLGTVPGTEKHEAWLHDLFAEFRLAGEWFDGKIVEQVLAIISAHRDTTKKTRSTTMSVPEGDRSGADSLSAVCKIHGLKMKAFSMKLTDRPGTHDTYVECGVEINYVLD